MGPFMNIWQHYKQNVASVHGLFAGCALVNFVSRVSYFCLDLLFNLSIVLGALRFKMSIFVCDAFV